MLNAYPQTPTRLHCIRKAQLNITAFFYCQMETRLWCTFSYNINYTLFSFFIYVYLIIRKIQQIIEIIFKKKTEGKKAFFFFFAPNIFHPNPPDLLL